MKKILLFGVSFLVVAYLIAYSIYINIIMFFGEKGGDFDSYSDTFFEYFIQPQQNITTMQNIFVEEIWAYYLLFPIAIFGALIWAFQDIFRTKDKYESADDYGIHGTAKWADPIKLMNGKIFAKASKSSYGSAKKTLSLPNGYVLGLVKDKKKAIVVQDDTEIDNQHMLVIGSSGAAKSQAFVIPNIINVRDKSIVVTDPKGELFNMTSQLKADQGYKVYQVDFVTFMESRYNPLTYVETDLQAQTVANTIISNFEGDGGGDNAFFKNNATNMLSALIIYVKTEYPKEQANMSTLVDVYTNYVQDEEVFNDWFKEIPNDHPSKKMLASILDLKGNTRASVTSTLNNGLSIFKLQKVQHMTSESDFMFDDFVNEKERAILYVKLSMENNTFNPLTSVFFSQMMDIFYDIAKKRPNGELPRKVLLLLDEFANIGKINNYGQYMTTSRSLGLILCTIIQNKAQLEKQKMYGKDEAKEIISGHDIKIFLRADQADSDTTKWISEAIGNTTVKQPKKSLTKSEKSVSRSENDEYVKKTLMPPEEVGRLKKDECIIMISGQNPIFAKKAFQFKIYPNLITNKKRELNYNNIRKTLGFTTPLLEKPNFIIQDEVSFSEYQQKKASSTTDESNQSEIEAAKIEKFVKERTEIINKKMEDLYNDLNNEEYTEEEQAAKDKFIEETKNDTNTEYTSYINEVAAKVTHMKKGEGELYFKSGMDIKPVEDERIKNSVNELKNMDIGM